MRKVSKGNIHVVVGDTQIKEGVPTKHLGWIGRYIAEQFGGLDDISIIHLGDHWDMPSLSSYDKGKAEMEGRRYMKDINAGNKAFDLLNEPICAVKGWKPKKHFLLGNHENRITRAGQDNPQLADTLTLDALGTRDWEVHPFLDILELGGISYSHYFYNPNTGRPYGGESVDTRLKTIGRSFTMGHQQGMRFGLRPVGTRRHQGLILGSTYLHEEKYLGPQATAYWRGIVVCHQVENGTYDPMMISLEYLCRRYEKKTLKEYLAA